MTLFVLILKFKKKEGLSLCFCQRQHHKTHSETKEIKILKLKYKIIDAHS